MEAILYLIIGLILGALVVYLLKKNDVAKATGELQASLNSQKEQFANEKSPI